MAEYQRLRKRLIIGACALVGVCGVCFGQRERVTFEPVEREILDAGLVIDSVHFEPLDVQSLLAEDRQRERLGQIPRFAVNNEVDYTPDRFGTVQLLDDGRIAWRLRIHCEDARSVNIGTLFDVPESMSMYLLNGEGFSRWGEFTSADEFGGQMWSPIVGGDVMEVYAEMDEADWAHFAGGFRITHVNIGYRGIGEALAGERVREDGTRSDRCHTDVACRDADPWCVEVKGAACYTIFGSGTCSGSVLNNTALDERPLFYTAFHCGMHDFPVQSRTYFNFQNATCREPGSTASGGSGTCGPINSGGIGCNATTIGGASVVATQQNADSVLLELASSIPDSYEVVYLGWNAAETPTQPTSNNPVVGIHHPGVEEKRIAFENDIITKQLISIGFAVNSWAVNFDNGGLEGGSSGSPLFDPDHYVIGTATGVDSFANICAQAQFYGRLEHAWDLNSAFRNALDPVGGGTTESLGHAQFFPDTPPESFGFELDDPEDGETGVETGPVLLWNGACYADEHRLIISENANLSNPVVDQVLPTPTTFLNLPDQTLAYSTTYYWAVEATNAQGTVATATDSFTTAPPPAPGPFNLVSPTNGSTEVETGPLLDWSVSSDANEYLVEVDTDPGFGSPDVNQIVPTPLTELDLADETLNYNTQYFWRVTAINLAGPTLSSPSISSFTTTAVPPCVCPGDLDGNCTTDVFDFTVFSQAFGSSTGDPEYNEDADYDGDGSVTVLDFGQWAADFGCIG